MFPAFSGLVVSYRFSDDRSTGAEESLISSSVPDSGRGWAGQIIIKVKRSVIGRGPQSR